MDLSFSIVFELGNKFPKYKGRVVLLGDIVKDDSGWYAVFTEQGSSASHMTVAIVLDVTSRLPRCARQASDALSVYTPVKMENASKLLFQDQSVRLFGFVYLGPHVRKTSDKIQDPMVRFGIFFTVTHRQDCCVSDNLKTA